MIGFATTIALAGCTVNINTSTPNTSNIDPIAIAEREIPDERSEFTSKDWETVATRTCLEFASTLESVSSNPNDYQAHSNRWSAATNLMFSDGEYKILTQIADIKALDSQAEADRTPWQERMVSTLMSQEEYRDYVMQVEKEATATCSKLGVKINFD
jgi:hypothetical protein